MGNLGRRIGLSQDKGDSNPGAAGGAVGGGILDLFSNGYFERQGDIYNDPGVPPGTGLAATGGVISDYSSGSDVYRAHIFTSTGEFNVTTLASGSITDAVEYLVIAGGGSGGTGQGGGGGAGGYRSSVVGENSGGGASAESTFNAIVAPYTVSVGGGGSGNLTGSDSPGTVGSVSYTHLTLPTILLL